MSQQPVPIDYLELAATDLAAAKRFYGQAFGWTFQDWGDDYVAFETGKLSGGFRKADAVTRGGPLPILFSKQLEAVQASVEKAGGTIVVPIFAFPGGRRFHFTDPSGNELAVWSDV